MNCSKLGDASRPQNDSPWHSERKPLPVPQSALVCDSVMVSNDKKSPSGLQAK